MENQTTAKPKKSFFTFVIFLIAVIASGVAGWAAWHVWNGQKQMVELDNQFKNQWQQTQTELGQLNEAQQTQQAALNRLQSITSSPHLKQAAYLANLAAYQLNFMQNVSATIGLLQAADQELSLVGDVSLLSLRSEIADDISQLRAVPIIDVPGSLSQIAALQKQVDKLVWIAPKLTQSGETLPSEPVASSWQKAMNFIKQFFIVKKLDAPLKPLLQDNQQIVLQQNLKILLEQAQVAVLSRQQPLYENNLQQVKIWIAEYFSPNDSTTQAAMTNLNELLAVNLQPALPDITKTVEAIEKEAAS